MMRITRAIAGIWGMALTSAAGTATCVATHPAPQAGPPPSRAPGPPAPAPPPALPAARHVPQRVVSVLNWVPDYYPDPRDLPLPAGVELGHSSGAGIVMPNDTAHYARNLAGAAAQARSISSAPGTCYLIDNEFPSFIRAVRQGPSHADWRSQIDAMTRWTQAFRNVRPAAWVGVYAQPLMNYWSQDEAWRSASLALVPYFKDGATCVYLGCYDFYSSPEDAAKFSSYVRLGLECAALAGGRPVMCVVQARYHNSTELGFQSIPDEELRAHLVNLLTTSYQGTRPAGLFLWGADAYYWAEASNCQTRNRDGTWKPNAELTRAQVEAGIASGTARWTHSGPVHERMRRVFLEEAGYLWHDRGPQGVADFIKSFVAPRMARIHRIALEARDIAAATP